MAEMETSITTGLVDNVAEQAPNAFVEKFKSSQNIMVDIALYGGIGFLTGFFMKKYSTAVVFLILTVLLFYVLQSINFITINWPIIHASFGIESSTMLSSDGLSLFLMEWVKGNLISAVSVILGFLIGLKMG